jgi:DNA-directed RNA polymerase subunit beta'
MGAEAIKKRLENFDMPGEAEMLRDIIQNGKGQRKTRALKRLKVVNAFLTTTNSPLGMVLDAVPVIPPELRPMVQLDGGRFATSDLNDLYRRVINRNNRLKRLLDLGAPRSSSTTRSACCRKPLTPCSTTAAAAVPSPGRATVR